MSDATTAPAVNPFAPTATTGGFEPCPAGNHIGILLALIDLGTHWDSFKDQAERKVRKIFLLFEVEVEGKDGKPQRFFIGAEFSMGYNDKGDGLVMGKKSNLRRLLEGWSGKSYVDGEVPDLSKALGRPCLVNVIHEGAGDKTYARLASVSKPVAGMSSLKPSREPFCFRADSKDEAPGARDTDKTEWLPRTFGEKIHMVVARSLERGGTGRKPDKNRPVKDYGESPEGFPHGANAQVDRQAEEAF
jgi:hypothetical protein